MSLTAGQLFSHVRHTLGGAAALEVGGGLSIVNTAGRFLYGAHPWWNMNRASALLDYGTSQSYVALPSNFGEIIALHETGTLTGSVEQVTLEYIAQLRATQTTGAAFTLYASQSYHTSNGVPVPVLEVWPTPATSQVGALTLFYRSAWVDLTNDADLVPVPSYAEPLMIELTRATARGWDMEDEGSLSDRYAAVMAGPIAMAAMRADSAGQPSLGMMRGGAADFGQPEAGWDQFVLA